MAESSKQLLFYSESRTIINKNVLIDVIYLWKGFEFKLWEDQVRRGETLTISDENIIVVSLSLI